MFANTEHIERCAVGLLVIVFCALPLYAATNVKIITSSGEDLGSIFDGIQPSKFFRPRSAQTPISRPVEWLPSDLDIPSRHRQPRLKLTCGGCSPICPECGVYQCADHFVVIDDVVNGCVNDVYCNDLPVHNFHYDTVHQTYAAGEQDIPCGCCCCSDAYNCVNP